MTNEPEQILSSLKNDLTTIQKQNLPPIEKAKQSNYRVRESCKMLSLWKSCNELSSVADQIQFIKEIKVPIYGFSFFHQDVFNFLTQKPEGDQRIQRIYIREQLYKITDNCNSHKGLYQYYRTGIADWDERYFSLVRKYESKYDSNGLIIQSEDDYSSTHDMLFGRIIANEMFSQFLKEEFSKYEKHSENTSSDKMTGNSHSGKYLKWTESKSALIELMYALHSCHCFNGGEAELKEIADVFQQTFKIDLGDYYRTYTEIKERSGRSKFLDKLRSTLLARMDEDYEK